MPGKCRLWNCTINISDAAENLHRQRRFGHVVTGISATLAGVSTEAHLVVIGETVADGFALFADLGADGAGIGMKVGGAEHEVGAGLAHLSTIEEEPNVRCFTHLSAAGEAMGDGEHADAMAVAAILNALLKLVGCHFRISHWTSLATW